MIFYIGIHGPKRVGKDEFARNLASHISTSEKDLGDRYNIDRLAEPLYVWGQAITGLPKSYLMGDEKDTPLTDLNTHNASLLGRTPRSILLDLGIFVRGQYGQSFLNDCLSMRAEEEAGHLSADLWLFVPDVRTEFEARRMDITFDLSRDGCAYEGSITEHEFSGVRVVPIHLKTCSDTSQACDFKAIYKALLKLKDIKQ
jgi:hypothetical protein